mgnify:FL=1
MARRKPVIGVTGPDRGGAAAWLFAALAVRRAGGVPKRIRPERPCSIETLDGLIIGGGADVAPSLYGEEKAALEELKRRERSLWRYLLTALLFPLIYLIRRILSTLRSPPGGDEARDALESQLIGAALERDLPLLGICRGMQLLNVVCGGTLHQDISDFYVEAPQVHTIWPYKRVRVDAGTRLASILECLDCRVNSLHTQAINDLAPSLRVAAREDTDIIQAVEHRERPFVLGVQWHPEYLPQRREQQNIFQRLVAEAKRRSGL